MIRPDYREIKHSNELYHYGIPRRSGRYPYGSGKRPYQSINSSALSVYRHANDKEKAITNDVKEVAMMSNCKLYGLENVLKTVDSIQRKINKKQIEDGKSEKEAMDSIHDSIRYTTISKNKDFVHNYKTFKESMSDRGYTEIECKNYFDLFNKGIVKHKAVQSQFSTKDGFIFEIQFQTPESQDAKTKKIPLYEERRKVGIDAKRANELENEMEKLALEVPNPPGIEEIKSHSSRSIKHSQESEVTFKMNNYYLSHGGPGSGRYPLGSGERPYQKLEDSKKRSSGISGYIKSRKAKKVEQQKQKQKAEDAKKRVEEAEKKRQHDADKERVLREGSASEVLKYKGELTNKELQDAYSRIDWERKLSAFSADEIKTGMQKMDKAMSNLKTINLWGSTLTDSYNLMASVYNATAEGKKKPWPEIKKSGGGKK